VSPARRAGAVIAIDHGTKKTGFAVADALRITTEPLEPFRGPGDSEGLLDHIAGLLAERDVSTLLVGLPRLASGDEGPRAAGVRAFSAKLAAPRRPPKTSCAKPATAAPPPARAATRGARWCSCATG